MTQQNNQNNMTLDGFKALLDIYGSHAHRWPEGQADAATALLAASSEARTLQTEAQALDHMLGTAEDAPASDTLIASLLAIPDTYAQDKKTPEKQNPPVRNGSGTSLRFLFPRLIGVAASAVAVGFVIGSTNLVPAETGLGIASFEVESYEIVDLSDWAFPNGDEGPVL